MKTSEFTTTILIADEGMYLTQSAEIENILERVVCTEVALGCNSSPDEWKEITIEEGDNIKAEQVAKRLEEEEQRRMESEQAIATFAAERNPGYAVMRE